MVFNKLLPAKNTVFSGHRSCVSTEFSSSARLGLTHFFQIVPLQRSRDAFTWLLYHTGCNCDDINFEVTLTHRTTRGYPFLLHPYWQSNRNICTSRLQFAVSFAGCLCSMSDYSSGNSLEPISVFECFLTQPWSVVSAQLAWNLTRGDTKKGTKHQVLPTQFLTMENPKGAGQTESRHVVLCGEARKIILCHINLIVKYLSLFLHDYLVTYSFQNLTKSCSFTALFSPLLRFDLSLFFLAARPPSGPPHTQKRLRHTHTYEHTHSDCLAMAIEA